MKRLLHRTLAADCCWRKRSSFHEKFMKKLLRSRLPCSEVHKGTHDKSTGMLSHFAKSSEIINSSLPSASQLINESEKKMNIVLNKLKVGLAGHEWESYREIYFSISVAHIKHTYILEREKYGDGSRFRAREKIYKCARWKKFESEKRFSCVFDK